MKITKTDITVLISAGLLIIIFGFLFWKAFTEQSESDSSSIVAAIEFKRNTAQRQFAESFKWERLQTTSAVYNGDTIRTADDSEARIIFTDGTVIELAGNTLISIGSDAKTRSIDFINGSISLRTASSDGIALSISTQDGSRIAFSSDASAHIVQKDTTMTLALDAGQGTITKGVLHELVDTSSEISLNKGSGTIEKTPRSFIPLEPAQGARFSKAEAIPALMHFKAESLDSENHTGMVFFELSSTADFSKNYSIIPAVQHENFFSAEIEISCGTWYWRIRAENGQTSSLPQRFMVYADAVVQAFAPYNGHRFSFLQEPPRIQFDWNRSDFADAYVIEIADSANFEHILSRVRTEHNRFTWSPQSVGTFFWRVTPIYHTIKPLNEIASIIYHFSVEQTTVMQPIDTFFPPAHASYDVHTLATTSLNFSWKAHAEAVRYELACATDSEMIAPFVHKTTQDTWLELEGSLIAGYLAENLVYWAVRWYDIQGTASPWSPIKSLHAFTSVSQSGLRTVYPPDNYVIESGILNSVLFSWRVDTNPVSVPTATVIFQVSSSPSFDEIVYERRVEKNRHSGVSLGLGIWYWRVLIEDDFEKTASQIRSFTVSDYLPPVDIIEPLQNSTRYVRATPVQLSWNAVEGADFYTVSLIKADDSSVVLQQAAYEGTHIEVDLSAYKTQDWVFSITAGAREMETHTRRSGYQKTRVFSTYRIDDIILLTPTATTSLDGLSVLRNGIKVQWTTEETLASSLLRVSSDPEGHTVLYQKRNPSRTELLPSLGKGTWYWTVTGTLASGEIVRADKTASFIVKAIPLLPAAVLREPAAHALIDFSYLAARKKIDFVWLPVTGASHYRIRLIRSRDKKVIFDRTVKNSRYSFTDLSVLSRETFVWELEAQSLNRNGIVEQKGLVASASFEIRLPTVAPVDASVGGDLYGL